MRADTEFMAACRAGKSAYETGIYQEAEAAFRWAAGLDPDNPIYSHAAALSAAKAGACEQAESLFLRAISAIQRTLGERHPFTLIVARDLSMHYLRSGRSENDVAPFAKRIVGCCDPLAIERSGDRTLKALSDLCTIAGQPSAAIPFFEAAAESRRKQYGNNHARTRFCTVTLAAIHSCADGPVTSRMPVESHDEPSCASG